MFVCQCFHREGKNPVEIDWSLALPWPHDHTHELQSVRISSDSEHFLGVSIMLICSHVIQLNPCNKTEREINLAMNGTYVICPKPRTSKCEALLCLASMFFPLQHATAFSSWAWGGLEDHWLPNFPVFQMDKGALRGQPGSPGRPWDYGAQLPCLRARLWLPAYFFSLLTPCWPIPIGLISRATWLTSSPFL